MNTNRQEQMVTRQDSRTANSEQRLMPASWKQNRLTAKLGIEYPIIQRSAWRIVIAKIDGRSVQLWRTRIVWRTQLAPDAIKDAIAEIRSLTSNRSR